MDRSTDADAEVIGVSPAAIEVFPAHNLGERAVIAKFLAEFF